MRIIVKILIVLVVTVIGLGAYGYYNAPHLLSNVLSKKFQVPVSVAGIDFKKSQFTIEALEISNPKEAKIPVALKTETIEVIAPYGNYLRKPILIDEVHVNEIYVNIQLYNTAQTEGNWQTLLSNMHQDRGGLFSIQRVSIIKKLLLTNIHIDLITADGKHHRVAPIKELEFNNISSEKGVPLQEISEIIVQHMMHSIFLQKGLQAIIKAPVDIIRGIVPFFGQTNPSN